jgi:hypothetical protein
MSSAYSRAIAAGATDDMIAAEAAKVRAGFYGSRKVVRNMVRALEIHAWNNTPEEWARLAGALS